MKLTFEQIKDITKGAARIEEIEERINFFRFTEEQENMYAESSKDFWGKSFATAGVRLEFITSSKNMALEVYVSPASSRNYFNHDIYVNGEHMYTLGSDVRNGADGRHIQIRGEYDLGEGEKTVKIYFPWSAKSRLVSLELDDGASITPVAHKLKMISFGDSITHGYDAANPSLSYASLLADALDAEAINKGIGGEFFCPKLAAIRDGIDPDIITVAYGTNDWSRIPPEQFERTSEEFYTNLSRLYPNAKIFALTPVWRGDIGKKTLIGAFSNVTKQLRKIESSLPNVTVVDCLDFIPHEATMFSSDVVHPNFLGFSYYADGVIEAIKKECEI